MFWFTGYFVILYIEWRDVCNITSSYVHAPTQTHLDTYTHTHTHTNTHMHTHVCTCVHVRVFKFYYDPDRCLLERHNCKYGIKIEYQEMTYSKKFGSNLVTLKQVDIF